MIFILPPKFCRGHFSDFYSCCKYRIHAAWFVYKTINESWEENITSPIFFIHPFHICFCVMRYIICESHSLVSDSLQPHGILQARTLEWVAFPFSRRSSQPRDWTQVSPIAGRFFTVWATKEGQHISTGKRIMPIWEQQLKLEGFCSLPYYVQQAACP